MGFPPKIILHHISGIFPFRSLINNPAKEKEGGLEKKKEGTMK